MIEREIIAGQICRTACHQLIVKLLCVNRARANCPDKSIVDFLPVKDLAAVQRLLQIEIRRGYFGKFHLSKVARRKNSVT
jgi:hypothetical protein